MKRKLFSVLLSAFALLLLMGAGPAPAQEVVMLAEEERVAADAAMLDTNEADGTELSAEAESEDPVPAENTDDKLLIDGVPAPKTLNKTYVDSVTYVALDPTAKLLDPNAQSSWSSVNNATTVITTKLKMVAQSGLPYVEANGRYLYVPDKVQMINGQMMVPLTTIAECFDAKVTWDPETGVTSVTRGSGAILPGDQFYNEDDLFWLSRVIYAESGNQPLEGKMGVGNVIMNRVASPRYPNTIKGVIAQKNQFSTYRGGKLASRTPNAASVIAAKLVLDGGEVEVIEDALYFDSSRNSWASRHRQCIAVIGGHRFYL